MATRILCKGNVLFLYGLGARSVQRQATNAVAVCLRGGRSYSSALNEDEDHGGDEALGGPQLLPPPPAPAHPKQLVAHKSAEDPASPWLDIKVGICGPEGFLPGMVNIPREDAWQPASGSNFDDLMENEMLQLEVAEILKDRDGEMVMDVSHGDKLDRFLSLTMLKDIGLMRDTFGKEIIHENNQDRHDRVVEDLLRSVKEREPSLFYFSHQLEFRAQKCPRLLLKDVARLLPGWWGHPVTAITISQRASHDMAQWSEAMEEEREGLMAAFVEKATQICHGLKAIGHFADFVDPSSGKPHLGQAGTGTLFPDDERFIHLGFSIDDMGCCKVINHNVYDSHVFVGVVFSTAGPEHPALQSVLKKAFEDTSKTRISDADR